MEKVAKVLGFSSPEDLKKDPIAELNNNPDLLKANLQIRKNFRKVPYGIPEQLI